MPSLRLGACWSNWRDFTLPGERIGIGALEDMGTRLREDDGAHGPRVREEDVASSH
jgi:hypothetical protein